MIYIKTNLKKLILLSKRLLRTLIDFIIIFIFSIKNLSKEKKLYDNNIVFVTAADEKFIVSCKRLLNSFKVHLGNHILIFYDLGCKEKSIQELKDIYPSLVVRKYDNKVNKFIPGSFLDNPLSSYNWKPVIFDEVLNEFKTKVVWIDSGNTINKKITFLKISLTANKFLVTKSSNKVKNLTHKNTLSYFNASEKILNRNNFAGGLVGVDYSNKNYRNLISEWKKFSQIKDVISPKGSNEFNHRYDQSILTLLLHNKVFTNSLYKFKLPLLNFSVGVLFHNKKIIDL